MIDVTAMAERVARGFVADRLRDEVGVDGRTLFKAVQKALDSWVDKNDLFGLKVEVDHSPRWVGSFRKQTRYDPPEYPELELEIDSVDVVFKHKPLNALTLVSAVAKATGADEDALLRSRAAMRTVTAAVDKWSMDMEDVDVTDGFSEMFPLPRGVLWLKAQLSGRNVVFTDTGVGEDDVHDKLFEYEEERGPE